MTGSLIKGQFKSFEEPNYIKVLDFTLSNMSSFSRIFSLKRFLCENIYLQLKFWWLANIFRKYFPHNYESILFVAVFLPIWNFIQESDLTFSVQCITYMSVMYVHMTLRLSKFFFHLHQSYWDCSACFSDAL